MKKEKLVVLSILLTGMSLQQAEAGFGSWLAEKANSVKNKVFGTKTNTVEQPVESLVESSVPQTLNAESLEGDVESLDQEEASQSFKSQEEEKLVGGNEAKQESDKNDKFEGVSATQDNKSGGLSTIQEEETDYSEGGSNKGPESASAKITPQIDEYHEPENNLQVAIYGKNYETPSVELNQPKNNLQVAIDEKNSKIPLELDQFFKEDTPGDTSQVALLKNDLLKNVNPQQKSRMKLYIAGAAVITTITLYALSVFYPEKFAEFVAWLARQAPEGLQERATEMLSSITTSLGAGFQSVMNSLSGFGSSLSGAVSDAYDSLASNASALGNYLSEGASNLGSSVSGAASGAYDYLGSNASALGSYLSQGASNLGSSAAGWYNSASQTASDAFDSVYDYVAPNVSNLYGKASQLFTNPQLSASGQSTAFVPNSAYEAAITPYDDGLKSTIKQGLKGLGAGAAVGGVVGGGLKLLKKLKPSWYSKLSGVGNKSQEVLLKSQGLDASTIDSLKQAIGQSAVSSLIEEPTKPLESVENESDWVDVDDE